MSRSEEQKDEVRTFQRQRGGPVKHEQYIPTVSGIEQVLKEK